MNVTLTPDHKYFDEQGNQYRSVSSLIDQYKERFDAEAIAARVARRDGVSPEEVKAQWSKAAPHGTRVHSLIEHYFEFGETVEGLHPNWFPVLEQIRYEGPCLSEVRVCSPEALVAGTADLLRLNDDESYSLFDWKTNATIRKRSYQGKRLKAPLAHLEDCNFVTYSLQLALYAELSGKNVKDTYIVHIPRECPLGTIEVIPALDLRKEAQLLLKIEAKKVVNHGS